MKQMRIIGLGILLAQCIFVSGVLAADSAIEVNSQVSAKIVLAVNPDLYWDFGSLDPESSPALRSDILHISSNKKWSIQAKDIISGAGNPYGSKPKPTGTKGYMAQWTGTSWVSPTSKLTDSLKIINSGTTYDLGVDPTIANGNKGTFSIPITLTQAIQYTDDPTVGPNKYRMIVTFVAAQSIE